MARKVNKKLVVALVAFGFVATTATGVLMVKSLQQTDPRHYIEQAERRAASQDWIQAKNYYLRAFSISRDATYLVRAGVMLYEKGDELSAERYWKEAVTIEPSLLEAHERIVDLRTEIAKLYQGPVHWRGVRERADALLEVDQDNAKGHYGLGLALMELAKNELDGSKKEQLESEGMEHINRAADLEPETVQYSLAQATYAHRAGQIEETEEILQRLMATHKSPGDDAARVRFTYARILSALDRHDEAIKLYEEAEAVAGDDPEVRATSKSKHAEYWVRRWYPLVRASGRGDPDHEAIEYQEKARQLLEESIEIDERAFLPYMLLADLHSFRGEHFEAIKICEQRVEKSIRREGIRAQQRKFSLYLLELKAAEECLAYAATMDRSDPEYDEWITKAEGFARDASAEYSGRGPGLHMIGRIKLAQGDELGAVAQLQRADKAFRSPNWRNSTMLARLLLRNGQPGAAREAIERALLDPRAEPTCVITYSQILLRIGDFSAAVQAADEALRRLPGNEEANRVKVAALTRLGETTHAEQIHSKLPGTPHDLLLQTEILYKEDKFEDALSVLEGLLADSPGDRTYLTQALRVLAKLGQHDRSLMLVKRAREASPDDIFIKLLELDTDKDLSSEQREQAQLEVLRSIGDRFKRHYELAMWYHRHNVREEFITHLDEAERLLDVADVALDRAARRKYLRQILEYQFSDALKRKDLERLERYVEKAVKEDIDGADGLTYRGRVHMLQRSPELALISFEAALEKQPANASTLTWLGQCHMAVDPPRVLEAQTYFLRAVAANPNMGLAQRGLASIARRRGDTEEFALRLNECARLIPKDRWVQAQLLAQREKATPLQGIERRLEIRMQEPDNVENLINLAQLYVRTGQTDEAAECFESVLALPLADMAPVVASAADFFRGVGNPQRALELIQQRVEQTPDSGKKAQFALLIAKHWNELGDFAKSEEALLKAAGYGESLRVCAAFAEFKTRRREYRAALEWYDRAIELADKEAPQLGARFRRNRVDVLLRSKDYDGARREIDAYLLQFPDDPEALLLLMAADAVQGDIDSAIEHLTRYLDSRPGDKSALLQRAGLYASQGRSELAIRDLEKLRGMDPAYRKYRPRILLSDAYALIDRLDLAYAELESIVRDDPEAKEVATHLIDVYHDRERYGDAVRISTYMTNVYPDEPLWLKHRGDMKVKLGGARTALGDYEAAARLSEAHPDYTQVLLQTYGELGLIKKGIQYYEQTIAPEKRAPRVMMRYAELLALGGRIDGAVEAFLIAFDANGFGDLRFRQDLATAVNSSCGGEQAIDLFRAQPAKPELRRAQQHVLALLLSRFRRHAEALTALETLLHTATEISEKTTLLATMGNMHELEENWALAKKTYEDLLEIDDRNIIGLNNLAYLLSDKLGRPADAVPYARRGSLISRNPSVHDTLAWTYVQLERYREAIAILTKILEEKPTFVGGIYHLAEAYRRSGEHQKAASVLEGAENLLADGLGKEYADRIRTCRSEIEDVSMVP